jgi:hypothetical protein
MCRMRLWRGSRHKGRGHGTHLDARWSPRDEICEFALPDALQRLVHLGRIHLTLDDVKDGDVARIPPGRLQSRLRLVGFHVSKTKSQITAIRKTRIRAVKWARGSRGNCGAEDVFVGMIEKSRGHRHRNNKILVGRLGMMEWGILFTWRVDTIMFLFCSSLLITSSTVVFLTDLVYRVLKVRMNNSSSTKIILAGPSQYSRFDPV